MSPAPLPAAVARPLPSAVMYPGADSPPGSGPLPIEEWAIPALIVGLPAILILLFVLVQAAGVSLWLPVVGRAIGPFALPALSRRRS